MSKASADTTVAGAIFGSYYRPAEAYRRTPRVACAAPVPLATTCCGGPDGGIIPRSVSGIRWGRSEVDGAGGDVTVQHPVLDPKTPQVATGRLPHASANEH